MAQDARYSNEMPQAGSLGEYLDAYANSLQAAIQSVSKAELQKLFDLLLKTVSAGKHVYSAGNGGSAAISDHLSCDWMKGTQAPGAPPLRAHSLTANVALLTAITNDRGYESGLSAQVEMLCEPGDVLVLISSSGESPNILKAAEAAHAKQVQVVGLSGFKGGKLHDVADIRLYVRANNYGLVEDAHQAIMHVLAQYLARIRENKR